MKAGGGNATALRCAAKRREALATAAPFTVATIGFCDAYLYCKGVLCYTLDDRVRVLDLHRSGRLEIVISIPRLLTQALSTDLGENGRGFFQILYYSNNIISCLYTSTGPDVTAWLIAFNIKCRAILVVEELDFTDKIFVRHNGQFLYYGTHSEVGTDGYKKWVIHGYEFKSHRWFDQKVHLPDMVGSEIGSTICFELHNGFFYALSNQTSFEVEEIDWTSFYHCVRFPLGSPCKELLEKTENNKMWRRQHQEGPIDDRWTSIRLDEDESTGELKIIESRKEWYLGSSRSQRTYYTTDIIFPDDSKEESSDSVYPPTATISSASISGFTSTPSFDSVPGSSNGLAFSSSSSFTSANTASTSSATNLAPSISNSTKLETRDLSGLPDDPLLRLLKPDDHPHHMRPPPRRPQNTHPGNDGSSKPTFTLAKSCLRYYHTSASTFLDLVDDPLPTDWQGTQRLRLRAGSRKLGPPLVHERGPMQGLLRGPSPDLATALKEMYRESEIVYWPPAQDPNKADEDLDAIYRLLNPPTHLGNVEGTADERSMVYVTGASDKPQAIIFVGFDPAIKLEGLKRWPGLKNWDDMCKEAVGERPHARLQNWGGGGMCRKGVGEGPHIDGRAAGCGDNDVIPIGSGLAPEANVGADERRYGDVEENDRTVSIDRKGKGKAKCASLAPVQLVGGQANVDIGNSEVGRAAGGVSRRWAWKEKAMYLDIRLGFYFGL